MTTPAPSDNTTLTSVLSAYASAGYDDQFTVDEDGSLRCCHCEQAAGPDEVELHSLRRLEGASDPDDMSAVLAVTCPRCGTKGTAVVMFGPQASPGETELLLRLQDRRAETDDLPAGGAPGEAVESSAELA
jgi:hypothetical protein